MFLADNIFTTGLASDGGGEHVDPSKNDVLATTGPLHACQALCLVTITALDLDASRALVEIQHRDSTDDETNPVESVVVACPADDCKQVEVLFRLESNENVTVVAYEDCIGRVLVAINWQQLP